MSNSYFAALGAQVDAAWQKFWFEPRDPRVVSVLRIIAGVSSLYFFLSFTSDLIVLFGSQGALDGTSVARLVTGFGTDSAYRFSLLQLSSETSYLYTIHVLSILCAAAMAVGLFSRITTPLTFFAVLSYIHRAPMITGPMEPVLTMLLAYLSLGPTGKYLSVDALWRRPKEIAPSVMANVSLRLIQVHLVGFYLLTGLTMLSGDVWWIGEGLLWLSGNVDSRLLDIRGWNTTKGIFLINFATHTVVLFMLLYGVLAWKRLARPILIGVSIPVWLLIGLLTGLLSYCALMMVLNVAFWNTDRV